MKTPFKTLAIGFCLIAWSGCGSESSGGKQPHTSNTLGGPVNSWCQGNAIYDFRTGSLTPCGDNRQCMHFFTPPNGQTARCVPITDK